MIDGPAALKTVFLFTALRPAASFQTEVVLVTFEDRHEVEDTLNSADSRLKLHTHKHRNILNIQLRAKSTLRTFSASGHNPKPADPDFSPGLADPVSEQG